MQLRPPVLSLMATSAVPALAAACGGGEPLSLEEYLRRAGKGA